MQDILHDIIATKRKEVAFLNATPSPVTRLPSPGEGLGVGLSLREALLRSATGIIAEFKRRSPSKGWIK